MSGMRQKLVRTLELDQTPPLIGLMEGRRRRILVVDDAKGVRDVLSSILSVMGFEVAVASAGLEGLQLFLESPFDLVMTDLQMPGIDGWTLALQIKNKSPHTPVVLITGQKQESVMGRLKESCVDAVMFKPLSLEDIDETVQRMFRQTEY